MTADRVRYLVKGVILDDEVVMREKSLDGSAGFVFSPLGLDAILSYLSRATQAEKHDV